MAYEVIFSKKTQKYLDKLAKKDKVLLRKFLEAAEEIGHFPYLGKKLKSHLTGYFRKRVGDYRIIYEIVPEKGLVYIEKIGHRKEIYK